MRIVGFGDNALEFLAEKYLVLLGVLHKIESKGSNDTLFEEMDELLEILLPILGKLRSDIGQHLVKV